MHTHICRDCHHTWRHKVPVEATTEEYDQAHMCTNCGKGPWRQKYTSTEEAREALNHPPEQEIPLELLLLEFLILGRAA